MTPTRFKRPLLSAVLALSGLACVTSAHALTFAFRDVGTTPMSSAQLTAFQAAGNYWSSQLRDNVTVYVDISFSSLGAGILGSTGSNFTTASYSSLRSAMVSDVKSTLDATATSHLQTGSALSFLATQGDLTTRLDNDGSINNTLLGLTTANAKALGMSPGTTAANPDATMNFSTNFSFDYDRSNGVTPGQYDFQTVVEHELGHALGFVSGVDDIDYCSGPNNVCGLPNTVDRFENDWWYEPLDLFRFSSAGQMDVRVGGSPYFSVDGGSTSIQTFSTGSSAHGGNGYQASHFGTGATTLMRPFVGSGQFYDASASDLAAFDAIGWDLAVAVPEPATWAFMLGGIAAIGALKRRRTA